MNTGLNPSAPKEEEEQQQQEGIRVVLKCGFSKGEEERKKSWEEFIEKLTEHLTRNILGPKWEEWRGWTVEVYCFEPETFLEYLLPDILNKCAPRRILRVYYLRHKLDELDDLKLDESNNSYRKGQPFFWYNELWHRLTLREKINKLEIELSDVLEGEGKRYCHRLDSNTLGILSRLLDTEDIGKEEWQFI